MSEGDLKELRDEKVELGVRRRVEYEDEEDGSYAIVYSRVVKTLFSAMV